MCVLLVCEMAATATLPKAVVCGAELRLECSVCLSRTQ